MSISIVLCSLSLLIFSISHTPFVRAETGSIPEKVDHVSPWDPDLRGAAGLGIVNDTAYFVVWATHNTLYKASIRTAKDWYKD